MGRTYNNDTTCVTMQVSELNGEQVKNMYVRVFSFAMQSHSNMSI
jgi:hypothetical protein